MRGGSTDEEESGGISVERVMAACPCSGIRGDNEECDEGDDFTSSVSSSPSSSSNLSPCLGMRKQVQG